MSHTPTITLSILFAAAFAATVCSTYFVRRIALHLGYVSVPRADRWSQRQVALLGGVGIVASALVTFGVLPLFVGAPLAAEVLFDPATAALLGGAVFIAALGLFDDLNPIKPSSKMIGQIACAAPLIGLGLHLNWTGFEVIDVLLTFFWVIGITNAFNLLDNMDGLSAGTGCIASVFCAVLFYKYGQIGPSVIAVTLAGATGGFLVFNFNPASIFMGDSGSLFIGFILAGLTLFSAGTREADLVAIVAVPAVLLAIPIFDTSLVTVMRKLSGRSISQGGRDHTSHRLVALGLSERDAVLLLWGLSSAAGLIAVLSNLRELPLGRLLLPLFLIFLLLLGIYLGRVQVYDEPATEIRERGLAGRITPLLTDLMYKRRICEVLLDLALAVLAYYGAYLLRFEQSPFDVNNHEFTQSLPFVVVCYMLGLFVFGAYRGLWRYTGLSELVAYAKAAVAGGALSALAVLALFRFEGYSRSIFVISALVFFLELAASRLSFRLIDTLIWHQSAGGRPAIIYGAGDGGQFVLRELMNNGALDFAPVGFLDDDPSKHRMKIHGRPVLGGIGRLDSIAEKYEISAIILASEKIPSERLIELAEICIDKGIEMHRLRMTIEIVGASGDPFDLGFDGWATQGD